MTEFIKKSESCGNGVCLTVLGGEKYKRCIISISFVLEGRRDMATDFAVLPHILERRCEAYPDPVELSRRLFSLYGADIQSESQTAGANRILTFSVSGLKSEYALYGEDLAGEYADLLCNFVFRPYLENGLFSGEDVEIEKEKQADFLKSEMNEKAAYCARQAKRKLYGDLPAGIESSGYLGDIPSVSPQSLFNAYRYMLENAHVEIFACGMAPEAAEVIIDRLAKIKRRPAGIKMPEAIPPGEGYRLYCEEMDTAQCKISILAASGEIEDARGDAAQRLASAIYGGLPTSRLFMNVREKQSLCYYCSSSYSGFSGILAINFGVDHHMARLAEEAVMREFELMKSVPVEEEELENAVKTLENAYVSAADSPDTLLSWVFNEKLRGTNRTIDEIVESLSKVTPGDIMEYFSKFRPAVRYMISSKGGGEE